MLLATHHPHRRSVMLWYPNPRFYTAAFIQGVPISRPAWGLCFGAGYGWCGHPWVGATCGPGIRPSLPGPVHPSPARLEVPSHEAGESRVNFIRSPRAVKA